MSLKLWPLLWSALWRKPGELILICLAVTAAFTLFGLMLGLKVTYRRALENSREDRLYVNARFPIVNGVKMPIAMRAGIARIPGVTRIGAYDQIYGYYQDPHNTGWVRAIDRDYERIHEELKISPAQWEQLHARPSGVLVSEKIAQRWHLKAGEPLPFIAVNGARADGSSAWMFQVIAVVPDPLSTNGFILGNYEYMEDSLPPAFRGQAIDFDVTVSKPEDANRISVSIDDSFANSGNPTLTIPYRASAENVQNSGISAAAIIWPVAGAGIFIILLVTANGIAQSVRERVLEFAVLSALGFPNGTLCGLVVAEALLPCVAGAVLGTGLAAALSGWAARNIPQNLGRVPEPAVTWLVALSALGLACALALLGSVPPVLRLRRLSVAGTFAGQ